MEDYIVNFHLTRDQAETICNYYGKDMNELEEYELCELLDRVIDELN